MCGGDITVSVDMTVGTCQYCGSTMTLPRIDTDKKARLFNRANEYRLNNEFDKAYDAYKAISEEDEQEAEAYWGMILSEYGVEYVEDPSSKKRIPTCHRTHVQPVLASTNYANACKYADAESKMLFRDEAEEIDRLQRKILTVSEKTEAYDVFICYKESDDLTGERTQDSVIAQTIYDELTAKHIKAFISRVSLEDKLGQDYEPYIYGALRSSRVMIVVMTRGDYCDAVWVKNEWKRYLGFMEENPEKVIIPVYRDMSVHEIPLELSKYQAQDMGKVGAIQDLSRGVAKILGLSDSSNDKVLNELIRDKKERDLQQIKDVQAKKRRKRIILTVGMFALAMVVGALIYSIFLKTPFIYAKANKMLQVGQYESAIQLYGEIGDYKDSSDKLKEAELQYLEAELREKNVQKALSILDSDYAIRGEGLLRVIAYYLEEKDVTNAQQYIDEYNNADFSYHDEGRITYYSNLVLASSGHADAGFNEVYSSYSEYENIMNEHIGVYYCNENEFYIAFREDGTVYFSSMNSRIKEEGLETLLDSKQYSDPEAFYFYNISDQKLYLVYKNVYFIISDNGNGIIIEAENEKTVKNLLYKYKYKNCPGKYDAVL